MIKNFRKTLVGLLLVAAFSGGTLAQDSKVADELAKYREALADGNPADLLEVKGEGLWAEKRGPKNRHLSSATWALARASWMALMPLCQNISRTPTR